MTDWIEHTGDTCPVDPETVVEVRVSPMGGAYVARAGSLYWDKRHWSHYRIVTPAKPPEPEEPFAPWDSWPKRSSEALPSEPDLINLRLECLKLALSVPQSQRDFIDLEDLAEAYLYYVLNGPMSKPKE
jgi:hypothetical protein